MVQYKSTAADATGLRLHQSQHHLDGHRCINGRTTGHQDLIARISRQWIGRSHREFFGGPSRLFLITDWIIWLIRSCIDECCVQGCARTHRQCQEKVRRGRGKQFHADDDSVKIGKNDRSQSIDDTLMAEWSAPIYG